MTIETAREISFNPKLMQRLTNYIAAVRSRGSQKPGVENAAFPGIKAAS
jgi:hypothetical protein